MNDKNSIEFSNTILGTFNPNFLLLNNNVIFNKDKAIESTFKYSGTQIHEYVHWFQFAGTIWGNYCLNLNQSQIELFENSAIFSDIHSVINDFKQISVDANYYLNKNSNASQNSLIFKQNWIDHSFVSQLFTFGNINDYNILNRCVDGIPYVRTNFHTCISYLNDLPIDKSINDFDKDFKFKNPRISIYNNEPLTVKHLFEGQARANDTIYKLLTLNKGSDKNDLQLFNNNIYWKAFYDYLHLSKININSINKKLHKELLKFNEISDIAL